MHVKKNGSAGWVSPTLFKVDAEGKNRVNVSSMSGGAALAIAVGYVMTYSSPLNSTARKSAADVLAAIKTGKKDDTFILNHPILNDNGEATDKTIDTHSMTRADLAKRCEGLVKISDLLAPAEAAAADVAKTIPEVTVLAAVSAGKRGKRSGGGLSV